MASKAADAISDFERTASLRAHGNREALEQARADKQHELDNTHNAPAHVVEATEAEHDKRIAYFENQARCWARRAEFGRQGYMLSSPDELRDGEYQREFADTIKAARDAGREWMSDESIDPTDGRGTGHYPGSYDYPKPPNT